MARRNCDGATRRKSQWTKTGVARIAVVAALLSASAVSAAPFEPPGNQVLFGMWMDPSDQYGDTALRINQKLGLRVPVFQIAQPIPVPPYNYTTGAGGNAPEGLIELSESDAAVFLTVYPQQGFDVVTDDDYTALGLQIQNYQRNYQRTVFLRFAPEMQGTWFRYGGQPNAFLEAWRRMHEVVVALAPPTIFVWAPNTPQGYPYGQSFSSMGSNSADRALLDTNGNGQLDSGDDAFSPYYPGDDYVDWIGLSIYYKGLASSDTRNALQHDGYCHDVLRGVNPLNGQAMSEFYNTYCAQKPTKACMFAESAAAWHTNDTASAVSQLDLQTAWIRDCITNMTMYDTYPRLKMVMQFEHEKFESANDGSQDFRDFRIMNESAILAELQAEFSSAGDRFSWASSRAAPTSISSQGAPAATDSLGNIIPGQITATTRGRPSGFPSLFGTLYDSSQRTEWIELAVLVTGAVAGALAVVRYV